MNKNNHKIIVDELADTCPCQDQYCSLKEFVFHMARDPRLLVQMKCMEKFKYEESNKKKYDIGWKKACEDWVELGFAEKFAKAYDEKKSINQIYKEILELN